LKKKLLEPAKDYFLYRDFQSRNIMLYKNDLYFIDYQSGRKGALQYDIASFLYDAKANMPQDLREKLLEYYIEEVNNITETDPKEFKHYFWFFAIIRILQAMGAYGYLGAVKGRKKFLESIPYALKNIMFILNYKIEKGSLEYLKTIFKDIKYETPSN
jgi:aminoglycoside/choline kinase family phosphotransferase